MWESQVSHGTGTSWGPGQAAPDPAEGPRGLSVSCDRRVESPEARPLLLDSGPKRAASLHWKNKDYFVGISVSQTLLLTAWFPLLSGLSELTSLPEQKK